MLLKPATLSGAIERRYMPTGYTANIADGITFEEYAWRCARAFGALINMRDDPSDAPIPEELKIDPYHLKEMRKSEAELNLLSGMTEIEIEAMVEKEYNEAIAERNESIAKNHDLMEKYAAMLSQVRAYVPPTPDHIELKVFMEEQIVKSMDFDNMLKYYADNPIIKKPVMRRVTDKVKSVKDSINYHIEEYKQEVNRTNDRNAWIKALRDSLK